MKRRRFLETLGWGTASWAVARCGYLRGRKGPPNIVFILADDMGYGDPRCFNPDSKIPTPHMDRLAGQGAKFTDAHSPSAVCTPTRYGILTGRYCWRTWLKRGVVGGYTPPLIEPTRPTVASFLRSQGYRTGYFGKWHLGLSWTRMNGFTPTWEDAEKMWRGSWQDGDPETGMNVDFRKSVGNGPVALGFDEAFFTAACSTIDGPFVFIENDRLTAFPERQIADYYDMSGGEEGSPRRGWCAEGFSLEEVDLRFTEKALAFMEKHMGDTSDEPFFVYLALSAPHTPWLPPDFVKGKSGDGLRGDLVVLTDWCVGEVMKALERLGVEDETLVIVTSDNGPHPGIEDHRSVGPLKGYKSHIWEGGHRVPFVVRWPGKTTPGTESEEPICLTDLMATFAGIVGADLPQGAGPDSYNIGPALLGRKGTPPIREALVSHSENGTFAIRRGVWKLILDNKTSGGWMRPAGKRPEPGTPGQLYNLEDDPYETTDLWKERKDVVSELEALLEKYQRDGHSVPR